jgi:hypothetical protein
VGKPLIISVYKKITPQIQGYFKSYGIWLTMPIGAEVHQGFAHTKVMNVIST